MSVHSLFQSFSDVLPGGVSSPIRSWKQVKQSPFVPIRGKGALLWDEEECTYLDYSMNFGSQILGHAPDPVLRAAKKQLEAGTAYGLTTSLEAELAEKIIAHIPSVERVRFVASGTEATMVAVRLARAFTQKKRVLKFQGHYHGHIRLLCDALNPSQEETVSLPFNDEEALEAFFTSPEKESIAAVIVEPIAGNMGVILPKDGFLSKLRAYTKDVGALLIFDEVITGFRIGLQGVFERIPVLADLTCLGKIIGGGFAIGAVGGATEILEQLAPIGSVFQGGTFSGNPMAMSAGLATMQELEKPGFYETLEKKTEHLRSVFEKSVGIGSMFSCEVEDFPLFFQYLLKNGIYISPSLNEPWFVSSAHTEEQIDFTRQVVKRFFSLSLKDKDAILRGINKGFSLLPCSL